MNILVLSTMYPNSKIYQSGVFVHEQVKELIKIGIEVKVVAPVPFVAPVISVLSEKWALFKKIPYFELIDGVQVYHPKYLALPGGLLKPIWFYFYLMGLKKLFKKYKIEMNFDIIHAHGSIPNDIAAYYLSKKFDIPYMITVHGESVYSLLNKKLQFYLSKKAIKYASAVIGVSSEVIKRIEKFIQRKNNVFKILNGYSNEQNSISSSKKNIDLKILMVATLIERKGCEYLIRAFSILQNKFPSISLTIVGGGKLLNKMKSLVISLKLSYEVSFTGNLAHRDVLREIQNCDIFVLPSWDEAFGVVYLEAMSMKKPVIGTKGEGICDIITDEYNGLLVEPKSIESLVNQLEKLISSSELRIKLGKRGYNSVKELTWHKNAIETSKVYQKILDSKLVSG